MKSVGVQRDLNGRLGTGDDVRLRNGGGVADNRRRFDRRRRDRRRFHRRRRDRRRFQRRRRPRDLHFGRPSAAAAAGGGGGGGGSGGSGGGGGGGGGDALAAARPRRRRRQFDVAARDAADTAQRHAALQAHRFVVDEPAPTKRNSSIRRFYWMATSSVPHKKLNVHV